MAAGSPPAGGELVEEREEMSPSGRYRLVVASFVVSPGGWMHSCGSVFSQKEGRLIATIRRNFHHFPFLFVEGHPKGDFLVAGEDYQGQTVVELTTGQRRDALSPGAEDGNGFCWGKFEFNEKNKILIVSGCFWGCPWECRFYDFTDPMNGWPEILLDESADESEKPPTLDADGVLKVYKTRDDDERQDKAEPIVDAVKTYQHEGLQFHLVGEWVSDFERARRTKEEEQQRTQLSWEATFRATDPLYLAYVALVQDPAFSPSRFEGQGQTYAGWGGTWHGQELLWSRRIVARQGEKGPTVDLEWAVETGPIKVNCYLDGAQVKTQFFPHSVDGMRQAFAAAKEFVQGETSSNA